MAFKEAHVYSTTLSILLRVERNNGPPVATVGTSHPPSLSNLVPLARVIGFSYLCRFDWIAHRAVAFTKSRPSLSACLMVVRGRVCRISCAL
jgi:hypothetical protein